MSANKIEIQAPAFPESITEGEVAKWNASVGDSVKRDAVLVEIETEKVVLEVTAPADGTLESIAAEEGAVIESKQTLGSFVPGEISAAAPAPAASAETPAAPAPAAAAAPSGSAPPMGPAARQQTRQLQVDPAKVTATGPRGRATPQDVRNAAAGPAPVPETTARRVPMSRLRRTIARRLVEVQQTNACLTTFNEIDMSAVMQMRRDYQERFTAAHGVRLGFMSFFVAAATRALTAMPIVNAQIDGDDVVYSDSADVGVAVSTDRGLVVPVIRHADSMSFAQIESQVVDFATRARDSKLQLHELTGGTFTITNGGIFGSLMSTPILNAPQSAILGMHKIQERPMVVGGEIVVRPMMYVALTYDHRIIDGKDSVQFLVRIKEAVENPESLLLEL